MEKLIFNVSDINSKNEKFVIIDKWYEKLIKLTPDNKLNLRYLNEYKFSIKKEKESFKEVDEVYEKLLYK